MGGAVMEAEREVAEVLVEGMAPAPEPALLQIGPGPPGGAAAGGAGHAESAQGWVTLPDIGPPSSRPVTAQAGDMTVLVCAVRGTLYAYRDACASCGSSLADGRLEREPLTRPPRGPRIDVPLAGPG